jgi:hypothetical protein
MKHIILIMSLLFVLVLSACTTTPIVGVHLNEGDDIVTVGTTHFDQGCVYGTGTAIFDMDVLRNTVDTDVLGEYVIDYTLTFESVTYSCTRVVKVVDDIAPTARLKAGVDTIYVGDIHIDAGITTSDNVDDDLTIEVINNVDETTPGTYEIVYVVTDDSGNKTLVTRTVTVLEAT